MDSSVPSSESVFLAAPAEIRMMIYSYLFDDGGNTHVIIHNAAPGYIDKEDGRLRTRYYNVQDRSFHRRCYETTYRLDAKDMYFCAALMRVNRQIHAETAYVVYGRHGFDFGNSIEAVEPFLSDLTPATRALVTDISLYKRGPVPLYENDRTEWRSMCRFLARRMPGEEGPQQQGGAGGSIKKLRLTVQGGKPNCVWDGPREFSPSDLNLLFDIKHDCMEWVAELAQVKSIRELQVVPDIHYCPPPSSTAMIVFAAFSASIDKGLTEFLRTKLRLT